MNLKVIFFPRNSASASFVYLRENENIRPMQKHASSDSYVATHKCVLQWICMA